MPATRRSRIEIDDLFELRLPGEVRIAPDGRTTLYVEKRASLEKNRYYHDLVLVDLEEKERRILTAGDTSDTSPCWTPESRSVVFVSDREGKEDLWLLRLHDGRTERLTDLHGSVRAPQVSPDGRFVAFLHAPRTAVQRALQADSNQFGPQFRHLNRLSYKLDGHGYVDNAWTHLWLLDLVSRKVRRLTSGACDDRQHAWSPNGRTLAFVSNRIQRADLHIHNSDVFVIPVAGGAPRQLTRETGPKHAPAWSPDGTSLAYLAPSRDADAVENLHVWVVPARGGACRDLMPDADLMGSNVVLGDTRVDVGGDMAPPVWSADGSRLFFLASHAGSVNVFEVPTQGGTPSARTHGQHEIAEFSQSVDGRRWVLLRLDAGNPGDLYAAHFSGRRGPEGARGERTARDIEMSVPGARLERLTRLHTRALGGKRLQAPGEYRIPSREGHEIHGWVLLAGGRARRAPAVLMVHGGPHAMYGWTYCHEFQMLAAAGYHVFYTNIRGSAGYGRQYMRAVVGRWGFEDFKDLTTVADWIESQPYVDRRRIALAGDSYGGFLTNWTIGHTPRFRCALSSRGISNLLSFYGTSDIGWLLHSEFDTHPWEAPERYWRTSPLAFVAHVRTPLLLLHPDDDLRCPVSQAEELFVALKVLGRDVEMVRFLGDSHALPRRGRPQNRLEHLRRIRDWLQRKL